MRTGFLDTIESHQPSVVLAAKPLLILALALTGGEHLQAQPSQTPPAVIRVATFNVSLNRSEAGQLTEDLSHHNAQAQQVATILRLVRPDIVLLNEFDFDSQHKSVRLFRELYLEAQTGNFADTKPLHLPHDFTAPVNTGQPSGMDLDHDGTTDGPADAFGFGQFPGQYGMLVLSRFPIDQAMARTFQKLLWKDLPSPSIPTDPESKAAWYSPAVWEKLRLSSKSHWIVPVKTPQGTLNILASHPTPPAFDGPEDRNGCRNHDEIALLRHIISGDSQTWLTDDRGVNGGLAASAAFVICGDLNADPADGDSFQNPVRSLLQHERVLANAPTSKGGVQAAEVQGQVNQEQLGNPAHDTADFSDRSVGNLRVDYCLPSANLKMKECGVFWPAMSETHANLLNCSDHRLVWADLHWP